MSAKEKAYKLFSQMYRTLFHTNADPIHAKQCALIAVDLHVNEYQSWAIAAICAEDFEYDYWKQVKIEIEKL